MSCPKPKPFSYVLFMSKKSFVVFLSLKGVAGMSELIFFVCGETAGGDVATSGKILYIKQGSVIRQKTSASLVRTK